MVTFRRSFMALAIILCIHAVAIFSGWYEHNRWFDIPMHFLGGAAIGLLFLAIWNAVIDKVVLKKSLKPGWGSLVYAVGILGGVALVGIAWKWYEFIFDRLMIHLSVNTLPAQMGLGETMADLFLDLLGGAVAFVAFRNRPEV